jgi:hypothetical protein
MALLWIFRVFRRMPLPDAKGFSRANKEQTEVGLSAVKEKGLQFALGLAAKFGGARIVAMALLVVGWCFLNTLYIKILGFKAGMTFWQMLSIVNSPMVGPLKDTIGAGASSWH